jgi:predicted O-methyltransferase YrrM
MSENQLIEALLTGKPYFGPAMRAMQSPPARHGYFAAIVKALSESKWQGHFHILEIGSWTGASAVTWAKAVQKLGREAKITCVDQWRPYFDEGLETASHYLAMNEAAKDDKVLKLFLHNIRAANVSHMVDYRVGDTRKVLPELPDAKFDIVYIDGSHVFEVVRTDIKEAKRLVQEGGIICGDDLELQRTEVDDGEHSLAVESKKDFVYSSKADAYYHPGVTEAVALEFREVSCWDGVWATRKLGSEWARVEMDAAAVQIPQHIKDANPEVEAVEVGQTRDYLLFKVGERFIATAKALGSTNLLIERLGERELPPILLHGDNLKEVRAKAIKTEEEQQPLVQLVDETSGFNLVKVKDRFLAIAKQLGPTKLFTERLGERELAPLLFTAENLRLVQEKALAFEKEMAAPHVELLEEIGRYNLIKAGDSFIAVAKELGPVNLLRERLGERDLPPVLFVARSIDEARRMVFRA